MSVPHRVSSAVAAPFSHHASGKPGALTNARFSRLVEQERSLCVRDAWNPENGSPTTATVAARTAALASAPVVLKPLTVCLRKRPINSSERDGSEIDVLTPLPDGRTLVVHEPKIRYDLTQHVANHSFTFDRVFGERVTTSDIYTSLLRPLVLGLDRGVQFTAFAYGQTGSGKSYTMTGLTERAVEDLFAVICADKNKARKLTVCLSFYEIYCSKCYDLLHDRAPLPLREDETGTVQVVGLTEHATRSVDVLRGLIGQALAARATGTTKVNADSSRSHAVLQLLVRDGHTRQLVGKASLVDLAGSEQASESAPPDKATHLEAAEINKSLLALKECIRAMARGQARAAVAAYPPNPFHSASGSGSASANASFSTGSDVYGDADESFDASDAEGGGYGDGEEQEWERERERDAAAVGQAAPRAPPKRPSSAAHYCSAGGSRARSSSSRAGRPPSRSRGKGKSGKMPHTHIPFRGSKLTQILRDCFTSPGAVTIMIATVGPGSVAAEHTLNTLRYADRLKEIGRAALANDAAAAHTHAGGSGQHYQRLSTAAAASATGVTTGLLQENRAGVRVGVLWNGGREVLPGQGDDSSSSSGGGGAVAASGGSGSAQRLPAELAMALHAKPKRYIASSDDDDDGNGAADGGAPPVPVVASRSSRSRQSLPTAAAAATLPPPLPPTHQQRQQSTSSEAGSRASIGSRKDSTGSDRSQQSQASKRSGAATASAAAPPAPAPATQRPVLAQQDRPLWVDVTVLPSPIDASAALITPAAPAPAAAAAASAGIRNSSISTGSLGSPTAGPASISTAAAATADADAAQDDLLAMLDAQIQQLTVLRQRVQAGASSTGSTGGSTPTAREAQEQRTPKSPAVAPMATAATSSATAAGRVSRPPSVSASAASSTTASPARQLAVQSLSSPPPPAVTAAAAASGAGSPSAAASRGTAAPRSRSVGVTSPSRSAAATTTVKPAVPVVARASIGGSGGSARPPTAGITTAGSGRVGRSPTKSSSSSSGGQQQGAVRGASRGAGSVGASSRASSRASSACGPRQNQQQPRSPVKPAPRHPAPAPVPAPAPAAAPAAAAAAAFAAIQRLGERSPYAGSFRLPASQAAPVAAAAAPRPSTGGSGGGGSRRALSAAPPPPAAATTAAVPPAPPAARKSLAGNPLPRPPSDATATTTSAAATPASGGGSGGSGGSGPSRAGLWERLYDPSKAKQVAAAAATATAVPTSPVRAKSRDVTAAARDRDRAFLRPAAAAPAAAAAAAAPASAAAAPAHHPHPHQLRPGEMSPEAASRARARARAAAAAATAVQSSRALATALALQSAAAPGGLSAALNSLAARERQVSVAPGIKGTRAGALMDVSGMRAGSLDAALVRIYGGRTH